MWQGLLLCALVSSAGIGTAALPGLADSGVSPLVFALLLGLLLGNLPGGLATPLRLEHAGPGLAFATRWLLRGGIVLFGLSLTLEQVMVLGPRILLLDLLVISSVLVVGYQLGTRWLGMDRDTALLTSAGSAICGAAAVLATEATIRARPAATAMAVATVVLFGSLAMLVYPLLYPLTGVPEGLYGIYIGATVHEVAQVVAAGDAVGPEALSNALIVKLVRVMMLVPFLLIVGRWWLGRTTSDAGDGAERPAGGGRHDDSLVCLRLRRHGRRQQPGHAAGDAARGAGAGRPVGTDHGHGGAGHHHPAGEPQGAGPQAADPGAVPVCPVDAGRRAGKPRPDGLSLTHDRRRTKKRR